MIPSICRRSLKLLCFLLLFLPAALHSQPEEHKLALEAVAKITGGAGVDKTTYLLTELGFAVPANLRAKWKDFPAYRKLETAWWAAAKTGDQELFTLLLAEKLSQEFQSVKYEPELKPFMDKMPAGVAANTHPARVRFGNLVDLRLPSSIDKEAALSLLSIVKYTDAHALGGTRGVLKFYYNLSDEQTFAVLRQSGSNFEALLKGLDLATIPPEKKERILEVVRKLMEEYAAASTDKALTAIAEIQTREKNPKGTALEEKSPVARTSADRTPWEKKAEESYDDFIRKNHLNDDKNRGFPSQRINPESFGGVILGNEVIAAPGLGKIKHIVWIPGADAQTITGTLECRWADDKSGSITGVRLEDIYAAHTIIYKNEKGRLQEGDAIGLTGAYFPDILDQDRVYDSLFRSFGMTEHELYFYTFRCEAKKRRQESTAFLTSAKKKLKELKDAIKNATTSGEAYQAYQIYNEQRLADSTQWARYNAKAREFSTKYKEWAIKYPAVLKRVNNMINRCKKIVLHPAVANLELGRSLIRADVMPDMDSLLVDRLVHRGMTEGEAKLCRKWLRHDDSTLLGWKFTDDTLLVGLNGSKLKVNRKADSALTVDSKGFLTFNSIFDRSNTQISIDFPQFPSVMNSLTTYIEDYNRVNQFARVMAIVRLAHRDGAAFLNKPGQPSLVKRPLYCKISDTGVELVDEQ